MSAKLGDYIDKYLQIRERKRVMEERHKEELRPLNDAMEKLEDFFQKNMDALGMDNLKAASGTAYLSTVSSVKAADKIAFLDFVREHDSWHLLDIRPAKTAMNEYVEEHGITPPGVDYTRITKVNVRKA
jgi:hypothetical protein